MIESNIIFEDLFIIPLIRVVVNENTFELEDDNNRTILSNNDFFLDNRGEQKNKDFRVLENYPNTKNILLKYIRSSLNKLGYVSEFDISTSWCTESSKGDFSAAHNHKNSWFSAVYYYGDYDENSGKFFIQNPLSDLTGFMDRVNHYNKFNRGETVIPPQKKHMIIFPSYLKHGISPHKSDLTRYSLAMNIVPVGIYGQYDSTYDTSWYGEGKK